MIKAKVFMNGRSQAIRLPKEFRVRTSEVYLERTKEGFQVMERDPWDSFLEGCREISAEAIAKREQPRLERRDALR